MKRTPRLTLGAILLGCLLATAPAQTFIWNGIGDGWRGSSAPTGAGGETLVFGDAVRQTVSLPATYSVDTLSFDNADRFRFVSSGSATNLTITGGISSAGDFGPNLDFADTINLSLTGNQTWNLSDFTTFYVHGKLSGTGNLTINGTGPALILTNTTGTPSDYSGTITLNPLASTSIGTTPSLVIWGNDSFSTGITNVAFGNGGNLTTHFAPTLGSNFTLNNGALLSGQVAYAPIVFRTWDGPATTLTGTVTLANNTTLRANPAWLNTVSGEYPNNTGDRPLPGPISRLPLLISGNIVESGGARSLYVTGPGVIILAGTNTYTGGTNVGFAPNLTTGVNQTANGSLIFANSAAIPVTGTIVAGAANSTNAQGYVGLATSAVPNAGDFNNFLYNKVDLTSSGAVGLDSLTGNLPAASPTTYAHDIDLSGFSTTATGGIRLGTATSVILTGAIYPDLITNYHFGNGGGKLYIQTSLGDVDGPTSLQTNNNGVALMLYLRGANTYSGGTLVNNGFAIFDGASAIPAVGLLQAGGSATNVGASYLGFTDTTLGGIAINGSNSGGLADGATGLFLKINKANTWGVIGFDSNNIATPTSIANLDLTGFNDGVFVGTTTKAVLTGTISLTTVTNANNTADTYRFTAADGGTLVVDSVLANGAGARSVMVGAPSGFQKMSDGTVVFNGTNTYSGGTFINSLGGITVSGAANSAFGTGTIFLQGTSGGYIGLSAANAGLNFANNIQFVTPGTGTTPQLMLTGSNDFTLSGNISGPALGNATGVGAVRLVNPTPINATVTGDNSGYFGEWTVGNGTLTFGSANAAGGGTLWLLSDAATAAFTTSATVRNIYGENGGHLHLSNGINLTFDTSAPAQDYSYEFGGAITGPGNVSTSASITVTSSAPGEMLYLYGSNQYAGGSAITGFGMLALGASDSAGTGTISINATGGQGGLILNDNVTLTNALVLTQGVLGGFGTFAPTSFNGTPGAPITIGANQGVFPGVPDDFFPGKLTFSGNTVFADGGGLVFGLQDASHAEGYGTLFITGNLDLTSVSLAAFDLYLETYDAFGEEGLAAGITLGNSYQFTLVETGGTISGFSADKFVFDSSLFQNDLYPAFAFNLTADSQHIYLNFQAVPEPSTYALLALGSGWVAFALRRRRRA